MAAIDVTPGGDARRLTVHAAAVGVGWFVIAFAGLVGLQVSDGARQWIESLPAAAQGMGATVLLAAAIPFAWPFYIAIGWSESGLASRIDAGDASGRRSAVRLLNAQAALWGLATVLAVGVAWLYRDAVGAGYVSLAWLPLAAFTALHLHTARRLSR